MTDSIYSPRLIFVFFCEQMDGVAEGGGGSPQLHFAIRIFFHVNASCTRINNNRDALQNSQPDCHH